MNIVYVDDNEIAVAKFKLISNNVICNDFIEYFQSPTKCLEYAKDSKEKGITINAAFLDIEMPQMGGIELARQLKNLFPFIAIVFITAYTRYALSAFGVDATGYLLKPYNQEQIKHEVDKIRIQLDGVNNKFEKACVTEEIEENITTNSGKKVEFVTMPYFEIFIDGKMFPISAKKPKELLAFLVDRNGLTVTPNQVISCLWQGKPNDEKMGSLYRMTYKRLKDILEKEGIADIIGQKDSCRFLQKDKCTSDISKLYKLIESHQYNVHIPEAYMSEYPWAEETLKRLLTLKP